MMATKSTGTSPQDDWWNTEYAENIIQILKQKEDTLPVFQSQSPQLYMRRCLVDWLALIVNKYNISDTSCHLAVHLMDYFMDNHEIVESRLQLVTLGCLSVACKFDEVDCKIPRLSELNKLTYNSYTLQDFLQIELIILEFFNWELFTPTAAHFSDYYIQFSVSSTDLVAGQKINVVSQFQNNVKKYVKYFLDVSLQDTIRHTLTDSKFETNFYSHSVLHRNKVMAVLNSIEFLPNSATMLLASQSALDMDKAAARASTKRKFETDNEDDSPEHDSSNSETSVRTPSPKSSDCSR